MGLLLEHHLHVYVMAVFLAEDDFHLLQVTTQVAACFGMKIQGLYMDLYSLAYLPPVVYLKPPDQNATENPGGMKLGNKDKLQLNNQPSTNVAYDV